MKKYILLCLISASCTYRINSIPYDKELALEKGDMFYTLPRTALEVQVTYLKSVTIVYENGIVKEKRPEEITVKEVTLKPFQENDNCQLFVLRGKNISHKFFLKENININFTEASTINSIQTEFEDQSIEFADNVLEGVSSAVKAVAIGGRGTDKLITDIHKKINATQALLIAAIESGNAADIKKYKDRIELYYKLLKELTENNKEVVAETSVKYTFHITPNFTAGNDITMADFPTIKISYDAGQQLNGNAAKITTKQSGKSPVIPGLVYPIPAYITTKITTDQQILFLSDISYSQSFNYGIAPIVSKLFSKKTTNLEIHQNTGTLKTYKTDASSSSDKPGKSIKKNSDLMLSTLKEIKYDLKINDLTKTKEIKDLEAALKDAPPSKKDSLNTQLELLKIQLQLEQVKKQLIDLEKQDKN